MKISFKRAAAMLAALAAAVSGALLLRARAAEDGYVLHIARDAYVCASPFVADYTLTGEDGQTVFTGENFVEIYHLTADGAGEQAVSIAAYSFSPDAEAPEKTGYRRVGLEDRGCFSAETAGKLRAVVQGSYPHKNVAAIQAAANPWLQSHGLPEIRQLQSGEAVLAAQLAVWELTNQGKFSVNDYLSRWEDMTTPGWRNYLKKVTNADVSRELLTEDSASNVAGLYRYLCSLRPAAPGCETVSDATLQNPVYTAVKESDGTYTVTVRVDIQTTVGSLDALTLSAECGGQVREQTVTEAGSCTVSFSGLADRQEVTLEIAGTQHGGDVYLFEGENHKLLGFDDSVLPVHGRLLVKPDCILNIQEREEGSGLPLSNIRFDLYRAATREQLESGAFSLSASSDEAAMNGFRTPENLVTILTTDIHGFASYNFTANNQPDGVYLVVQRTEGEAAEISAPFFLVVPGVGADGENAYTLNVKPTGTVETAPGAQVNVGEAGSTSGSFDAGQIHTWILRGSVPSGIRTAQKYTITGSFDEHLALEDSAPAVTLLTRAGTEIDLTESDHYTVSHNDGSGELCVSLTPAGMAYAAANQGEGTCVPEIRVRVQAEITENAGLGTSIPCVASIGYLNSAGVFYEAQSEAGEVHTGGIHLFVSDEAGQPLSGGTFRLARAGESSDGESAVLKVNGTEINATFVNFLTEDGKKPVSEVTTGEDGTAFLWGVTYGRYYLVQTKAPEGRDKLSQPVAVTVNASSHLTAQDGWRDAHGMTVDNTVRLINGEEILPKTGDVSAVVFVIAGSILIGAICALILEILFRAAKRRIRR